MAASRVRRDTAEQAYREQWAALRAWVGDLPADAWSRPTVLPGWSVSDLVAHVGLVAATVVTALGAPSRDRPTTVAAYLASYAEVAAAIDDGARAAGAHGRDAVLDGVDRSAAAAAEALERLAPGADPVVAASRGPLRLSDLLVTRCVELVVHGDDLARSLGRADVPLERAALRLAVRSLADALAARAPGRSVEVRIPPFAAVQCVAGPSHTRGSPPAVVEADPLVFLRLASGRVGWAEAEAAGAVRRSGLRTDLSAYLPVLS